jgi:Domain of unknown function (DUF4138)
MKQLVCLVYAAGWFVSSFAQVSSLTITTNKTTSLVFPFEIKHVDRGSKDILVQQVKEADNILLVKASDKDFPESNLTVVLSDGSVHNFTVDYGDNPLTFVFKIPTLSSASLATYANSILQNPKSMHGIAAHQGEMLARVSGIFIKGNVMYFQIQFSNQTTLDYDIDFIRFYIRDKKKSKRTAIQENELKPFYIAGNISKVKANSSSDAVIALEKHTIPDAKFLAIVMNEKNGGRNLSMKVNNRKLIKAIPLQDLK